MAATTTKPAKRANGTIAPTWLDTPRGRTIIKRFIVGGLNRSEIGRKFGISTARIRPLLNAILTETGLKIAKSKHRCVPVSMGKGHCFITAKQVKTANREGDKLGYSRLLDLPKHGQNLRFPISEAWHHTSGEGYTNYRLMFVFAENLKGRGMTSVVLDVTPEMFDRIVMQRIAA